MGYGTNGYYYKLKKTKDGFIAKIDKAGESRRTLPIEARHIGAAHDRVKAYIAELSKTSAT